MVRGGHVWPMTARRRSNETKTDATREVDAALLALARLLGRQMARQRALELKESKNDENPREFI